MQQLLRPKTKKLRELDAESAEKKASEQKFLVSKTTKRGRKRN
jgi:hypothetical protein